MTGFPLFRLPLLPLKSALDMMNFWELLYLHFCSKKTRELCKLVKKSVSIDNLSNDQKARLNTMEIISLLQLKAQNNPRALFGCFPYVNITIKISGKLRLQIDSPYSYESNYNDCFPFSIEVKDIHYKPMFAGLENKLKIDGTSVPIEMTDKRTIVTFWKNPGKGFSTLLAYFQKFFNTRINQCFLCGSNDPIFSQNLRAAVGSGQQTIDSCELKYDFKTEDYKFILDNIKPTNCFKQSNYTGKLSKNFSHKTSFNLVTFELGQANWFTLDNLITTNCVYITLLGSRLTNDDMCDYLKLWMDKKFEKLRNLTVELRENVNLAHVFWKLEKYSRRYTVVQEYSGIRIKQHGKRDATFSGSAKKIRFNIY